MQIISGVSAESIAAALGGSPGVVDGGVYVGDSTNDRAIPHNLGKTPKAVFLIEGNGSEHEYIFGPYLAWQCGSSYGSFTVKVADENNFYVGDSSDYSRSGNDNGSSYRWVALA